MADSLDYAVNEYQCPYCGNTEYMRIVKVGDDWWDAVIGQNCSECDEPFDLETWTDVDYESNAFFDEDDEDDDDYRRNGFFFEEDLITETDEVEDE